MAIGEDYIASHEQFRGIVLFHRTEAAFALALERHRPEEAIDALREGIDRLTTHQRVWWEEHDPSESPNPTLVEQLRKIEQEIRQKFLVEKTLREQLDEAVAREDYEQAARLRDQIQAQAQAGGSPQQSGHCWPGRITGEHVKLQWAICQSTRSADTTGPSTQTLRRSTEPSSWRIGATQLKHAPKPHAMWFSSETSQGMRWVATSLARAASMAGGPQPTTFAGLSPRVQSACQQLGDEAVVPSRPVVGC